MRLSLAVVAAVAASLTSCDPSRTAEETKQAFRGAGYTLATPGPSDLPDAPEGILMPRGGEPFVVIVGTNEEADEVWPQYAEPQTADTFDARRANVVVISDSGLRAADRKRVKAALALLTDRGFPVVVSELG